MRNPSEQINLLEIYHRSTAVDRSSLDERGRRRHMLLGHPEYITINVFQFLIWRIAAADRRRRHHRYRRLLRRHGGGFFVRARWLFRSRELKRRRRRRYYYYSCWILNMVVGCCCYTMPSRSICWPLCRPDPFLNATFALTYPRCYLYSERVFLTRIRHSLNTLATSILSERKSRIITITMWKYIHSIGKSKPFT